MKMSDIFARINNVVRTDERPYQTVNIKRLRLEHPEWEWKTKRIRSRFQLSSWEGNSRTDYVGSRGSNRAVVSRNILGGWVIGFYFESDTYLPERYILYCDWAGGAVTPGGSNVPPVEEDSHTLLSTEALDSRVARYNSLHGK